ncbi:alginate O-acetyltransferase [Alkalimarinus alittae]|uniref:Probable alginate O-acetylase AlgJ n=1 Tax=Alkalimarinus alittae TaxID=2961619 RepID=A0ABY6N2T7_9ALTE|nr:alginate O-acetyltransferase [Alkalimarinus alittae]UZE96307.1 alginate O-acetyltransferase [Alkalimarinus alittae]
MKKISYNFPGLAFGASLILIGGLSIGGYANYTIQDKSWITGDQAAAFEDHYDDQLPIKNIGVNVWAAIEYALFNEGRSGVEIGKEGWLFSSEEFKAYSADQNHTAQNLDTIKAIATQLKQQNIQLVVAVVPAKASIYPEYLGDHRPSNSASQRYLSFTQWLQAEGIHWTGFKEPMLQTKDAQQMYLRTDTHWTPAGAKIAATQLKETIASLDAEILGDSTQFSTSVLTSQQHEGDLMSFIPFRDYFSWMGPQPETIEPQVTQINSATSLDDADALLFADEPSFDITLVGTSYSANKLWNFPGALEQQLGQEILNYAEEGKGPIEPMITYLSSEDFANAPPRILIWEFPERFLPIKYKTHTEMALTKAIDDKKPTTNQEPSA